MRPKTAPFAKTFATLRGILEHHGRSLMVIADGPGDFQLAFPDKFDHTGRPLSVAAVQIKKNYVSFHLMPLYADQALLETVSTALRKRMQGKSCFNFTTIDSAQVGELSALTKKGIARFRKAKLPWE